MHSLKRLKNGKKGIYRPERCLCGVEFNDKFVADYSRRVKSKDWKGKISVQLFYSHTIYIQNIQKLYGCYVLYDHYFTKISS